MDYRDRYLERYESETETRVVRISTSAVFSVYSAMLASFERIREGRLMRSSLGSMRQVIIVSVRWILVLCGE